MQILALSRRMPGASDAQIAPLAEAEAAAAFALYASGVFRSMHMLPERPGAMVVLECESIEAARAAMSALPMVKAGLIDFDYSRMLPYSGFKVLFKNTGGP
jgi:hypothetical protein